jgi:hypothetical protein
VQRRVLWETYETHKDSLCVQNVELFNFELGGTYENHRPLKGWYKWIGVVVVIIIIICFCQIYVGHLNYIRETNRVYGI